jgi:predicted AAA+ superfamily ATPase
MRQVGKSFLLNAMKEEGRKYVSLDDFNLREFAKRDPGLFLETYSPPVIIDEIQYAPELFTYIKIIVDGNPKRKGMFWLSGSQQFNLMRGVHETLAGRIAILQMSGLSHREIAGNAGQAVPFLPSFDLLKSDLPVKRPSVEDVYRLIWRGFYPEIVDNPNINRDTFYKGYVQTYIERDVRDDLGDGNALGFYDFIRVIAARTGNLLNYADIARDCDINVKTAKKWLETLVRAGIVYLLEPYSKNISQRVIKTPKIYFLDTGLCAYLTRWDTPEALMNGAMSGAFLETFALAEILKSYRNCGKEENIYFYRDGNAKEIDFVIEKNMALYPIEVKKSASPKESDVKNFSQLSNSANIETGALLCFYPTALPLNRQVLSIPVWSI